MTKQHNLKVAMTDLKRSGKFTAFDVRLIEGEFYHLDIDLGTVTIKIVGPAIHVFWADRCLQYHTAVYSIAHPVAKYLIERISVSGRN